MESNDSLSVSKPSCIVSKEEEQKRTVSTHRDQVLGDLLLFFLELGTGKFACTKVS